MSADPPRIPWKGKTSGLNVGMSESIRFYGILAGMTVNGTVNAFL